jgi:hypothetical protein
MSVTSSIVGAGIHAINGNRRGPEPARVEGRLTRRAEPPGCRVPDHWARRFRRGRVPGAVPPVARRARVRGRPDLAGADRGSPRPGRTPDQPAAARGGPQAEPRDRGRRIVAPIFIVGLPRTGSTALHHLLAQDPDTRAPQAWEVMSPSPPPTRETYETDPRIARAAQQLRWLDWLAPDFKTIHPVGAQLPLECIAIMSACFLAALPDHVQRPRLRGLAGQSGHAAGLRIPPPLSPAPSVARREPAGC